MPAKRLRIFAGPNGSGKSTIFKAISGYFHCKYFVNADDIQRILTEKGSLNLDDYTIIADRDSFIDGLKASGLFKRIRFGHKIIEEVRIVRNHIEIPKQYMDSYVAAYVAEYIRINMLNVVTQFTIETVLSDARKIEYIRQAKALGYRIYLYFVTTRDVRINIERVKQRVALGGHDVSEEKIGSRYEKSLGNLYEVLKLSDRAYLFDNSTEQWQLIAECEGAELHLTTEMTPSWFCDYVLSKIEASQQ